MELLGIYVPNILASYWCPEQLLHIVSTTELKEHTPPYLYQVDILIPFNSSVLY